MVETRRNLQLLIWANDEPASKPGGVRVANTLAVGPMLGAGSKGSLDQPHRMIRSGREPAQGCDRKWPRPALVDSSESHLSCR